MSTYARQLAFPGPEGRADERLVVPGDLHQALDRDAREGVRHRRVEVGAPAAGDLLARGVYWQRRAVRPVRRHGVEHVGHRHDARHQRDILALEAVRIPRAVEPLVVAAYRARFAIEEAQRLED